MTTSASSSSTSNTNKPANSKNSIPSTKNNNTSKTSFKSSNNSYKSVILLNSTTPPVSKSMEPNSAATTSFCLSISSDSTPVHSSNKSPDCIPRSVTKKSTNLTATSSMTRMPISSMALTSSSNSSYILSTTPTLTTIFQSNSRPMQSDDDFNIRFVNLVRQYRCLYDKKVPEYRNRDNQEKAWALISKETQENVVNCKERWRNLRACLSRYIKQQSGSDPQHKPYYLTEHMAFLLPFLKSSRNSLNGNNTLAQLYQYSQQQYQYSIQHQQKSTNNLHFLSHFGTNNLSSSNLNTNNKSNKNSNGHSKNINNNNFISNNNDPKNISQFGNDMTHSISEVYNEEALDAFNPGVTQRNKQSVQRHYKNSPALSDTASANTINSFTHFIPDVQLSELQTSDVVNSNIAYLNQQNHPHVTAYRRNSNDYNVNNPHSQQQTLNHQPMKRIKTECYTSESTKTATMALYNSENSDLEFFRSILPDIASLTHYQKRKLKIGILGLIDDVIERYPTESTILTSNANHNNSNNNNNINLNNNFLINANMNNNQNNKIDGNNKGPKIRNSSTQEWRNVI